MTAFSRHFGIPCWLMLLTSVCLMPELSGSEPVPEESQQKLSAEEKFFREKIAPALKQHCWKCHSADARDLQGGLRLDDRSAMINGGDSGPALIPGKPDDSLLIDAVRFGELIQMPPKGKLPAEIIRNFERWVTNGAVWAN